ncbi:MAG: hypothetical protein JGK10_27660 [Microcoleus sp. PH2017_13_LAR_U_A]|uniref:hypothetical protein n=2 Tax=Microcoleus TaxID=44471 RepID=UPI001DA96F13|nr:hypothetical protein [Microcoleus sp. PH2017_13_LAR_U_A]MCC3475472.1 hypothetical protein [Microcoleus sp. PH2017_13_LAR_U_A]
MGEAKRRKEAQARGIPTVPRRKIFTKFEKTFAKLCEKFACDGDFELQQAREQSPLLAEIWLRMVAFAQLAEAGSITKTEAVNFWITYWEDDVVNILGRIDIRLPKHWYWLTRIKGVTVLAVKELCNSLGKRYEDFLKEIQTQFVSIGETTIEIGLAFHENNIIYWGESLIIHKGKDNTNDRGELMIAVKHSSGCWNYYPSRDNLTIPLSDYKKAKLALEQFPDPLKGELMHSQSGKLAELLGLTIKDNYAYLIKFLKIR